MGPGPTPISMSMYSSVVACSSSARASDTVRIGRLISSENSLPLAKLVTPNRWRKIVFGPIDVRMLSCSDVSKPRMSAVIATIDVMPITTPSTVSPERSLFVRTVSKAMTMTSRTSP